MLSKRFDIASGDLTSGEILIDLKIEKTLTASNNTRTIKYYPSTITLFNNCNANVDIHFFGNDTEYGEYTSGSNDYGAIRFVPDDTQFTLPFLPIARKAVVKVGAGMDADLILNFFNYRELKD